jgi:hypothetical protein
MAKRASSRKADLVGEPPKLATLDDLAFPTTTRSGRQHASQRSSSTHKGGAMRINLRMVSEALVEEGLDPTLEMIKILKKEVPVLDVNGKPRLAKDGTPMMRSALDDDTKLRTLNELLQYTQPKLKSVEMKVSGNLELTNEQLDSRLLMLLGKAVK